MVVRYTLVDDLLGESCHSQWVLDLELSLRFATAVTVDLLVELTCSNDGAVVAQVQTICPLYLVSIVDLGKAYH